MIVPESNAFGGGAEASGVGCRPVTARNAGKERRRDGREKEGHGQVRCGKVLGKEKRTLVGVFDFTSQGGRVEGRVGDVQQQRGWMSYGYEAAAAKLAVTLLSRVTSSWESWGRQNSGPSQSLSWRWQRQRLIPQQIMAQRENSMESVGPAIVESAGRWWGSLHCACACY